jgi:hypothetical protein
VKFHERKIKEKPITFVFKHLTNSTLNIEETHDLTELLNLKFQRSVRPNDDLDLQLSRFKHDKNHGSVEEKVGGYSPRVSPCTKQRGKLRGKAGLSPLVDPLHVPIPFSISFC